ncbi:MAG: response regulator [Myxococcales bacterium]|nr:response regulator [Myxococcales bacterium]
MKLLLIDDDLDIRTLLKAALISQGLEVMEAGSAHEAEVRLNGQQVDLLVVDGLLPDAPGLAFIKKLRTMGVKTPIVYMSEFFGDLKAFNRITRELAVSLVVYKPVEPASFAATVAELMRPATSGPAAAPVLPPPPRLGPEMAELAELKRQFTARLPEKLDALELAIETAKLEGTRLGDARMLAHRLHGSAGSYGYPALGEAMGVVEDLLKATPASASGAHFFWEQVARALMDARLSASRVPEECLPGSVAPGGTTKALLIVDDDADFLRMVKGLAARLLIEVVSARSTDEAMQRANGQPLLGAILDVHLHEEDSFALARRLRETPSNEEIPIAFSSVDGRIATRVSAIEAGGTKFFDKPISEESFGELVQQFLRLSQDRQGRVLIVDDDPDVVAHYSHLLHGVGFAVEAVHSADVLVDKLEEVRPDVLLLDVNLPHVSGIDVCRALRISDRWELLPILIVTAHLDPELRLRAFRAGASDVIAKPVLPEELVARVSVQEERMRLLRDRADKDPLSGLMLRRAFVEALQRPLATCAREKKPLSLVLLDLDHFKAINDTHGHLSGDRVIAGLGELLRRRFRVEDLRARWGGEEFALVFPGQGKEFAVAAARRILAEFALIRFVGDDGTSFGATFTAGVAECPAEGNSIATLIRSADAFLYDGKRAGRNQVYAGPTGERQ